VVVINVLRGQWCYVLLLGSVVTAVTYLASAAGVEAFEYIVLYVSPTQKSEDPILISEISCHALSVGIINCNGRVTLVYSDQLEQLTFILYRYIQFRLLIYMFTTIFV